MEPLSVWSPQAHRKRCYRIISIEIAVLKALWRQVAGVSLARALLSCCLSDALAIFLIFLSDISMDKTSQALYGEAVSERVA
ncbi:MAG: hypothetical protein V8Q84_01460 [Bilophila sp.]